MVFLGFGVGDWEWEGGDGGWVFGLCLRAILRVVRIMSCYVIAGIVCMNTVCYFF